MNAFVVNFCIFLTLSTIASAFGQTFDIDASYALFNGTVPLNDPLMFTPFMCNDTIEVALNQVIYFRFKSKTYIKDAGCFIYTPETNLYKDAYWDFYKAQRDAYTVYAVGKISSFSDIYYVSFTALVHMKEVYNFCDISLVAPTFFWPIVCGISAIVLLCLLAGIWIYRRKINSKTPSLISQKSKEMERSNYYENMEFYSSNNMSKIAEK